MDQDWYTDLMDAQNGVQSGRVVLDDLDLARANALDEELRRHELAMVADPKYAHPYMRLGAEIRGRIGGAASLSLTVPVQVNVYPGGYDKMLEDAEPPPKRTRARARRPADKE